ncbi:hypothetical protein Aco03nite_068610 [Actinoplanes couchii]|uniref:Uncharacterized protein n=1 Tax=Actinoplanes couchii TaxID=403638 RepID=A0ABQ3XIX6_9ACTN|nr:hypothetical protein Aco03nite_068610 [Actinoplanes couchii]
MGLVIAENLVDHDGQLVDREHVDLPGELDHHLVGCTLNRDGQLGSLHAAQPILFGANQPVRRGQTECATTMILLM